VWVPKLRMLLVLRSKVLAHAWVSHQTAIQVQIGPLPTVGAGFLLGVNMAGNRKAY
jgi:hypothetical protein